MCFRFIPFFYGRVFMKLFHMFIYPNLEVM
jgi:hypothetical protein